MYGLEGAGKTMLLYKLKLPHWQRAQLIDDLKKLELKEGADGSIDRGYHYEEFDKGGSFGKYGLWDIPGSAEMVPMWPVFYRYIPISGVIFVVDGADYEDVSKMMTVRQHIEFLYNEPELALCGFLVLINVGKSDEARTPDKKTDPEARTPDTKTDPEARAAPAYAALRLNGIEKNVDRRRKRLFQMAMDVSDAKETDGIWRSIMEDFNECLMRLQPGAIR